MSFDLDFRPRSYTDFDDPVALALNGIPGQMRREMVRDMLTAEGDQRAVYDMLLGPVNPDILDDRASGDFVRHMSRSCGPMWMGGEFLPPLRPGEVEIARVVLDSVTMDVYSMRAQWCGDRYGYRLVGEYPETDYELRRETSRRTLTLRQLIDQLETVDWYGSEESIVRCWWEQQWSRGYPPDECTAFAWVESELYPQLAGWYRSEARQWEMDHAAEWEAKHGEEAES